MLPQTMGSEMQNVEENEGSEHLSRIIMVCRLETLMMFMKLNFD